MKTLEPIREAELTQLLKLHLEYDSVYQYVPKEFRVSTLAARFGLTIGEVIERLNKLKGG